MLGKQPIRTTSAITLPVRTIHDEPDCLFGPRHFLTVDATEAERPIANGHVLDLRRSGWDFDRALVRGALAAAAWCCRLAEGQALTMTVLAERYHAFVAEHGARGLDPFDTALITVPPWQLVVSVIERLERPAMFPHHRRHRGRRSSGADHLDKPRFSPDPRWSGAGG